MAIAADKSGEGFLGKAAQKGAMNNKTIFTIRCGPCYGVGHYEDNSPCQVCKSKGQIELEGDAGDYMDCGGCAGSGFSGFNNQAICIRCEGVGAIRKILRRGI